MRTRSALAWPLLLAVTSIPTAAATSGTPAEVESELAAIADQTYYPEGYREMRAAATLLEREADAPTPPEEAAPTPNPRPDGRRPRVRVMAPRPGSATRNPDGTSQIAWAVLQPNPSAEATPSELPLLRLSICRWSPHLDSAQPAEAVLELTARRVALIDHRLRAADYPSYLFENLVRDYEREMLSLGAQAPLDDRNLALAHMRRGMEQLDDTLIRELEARRAQHRGSLPQVVAEGECIPSVSEIAPSLVATAPAGGRVWVIPAFQFLRCRADWDVDRCRRWREVYPEQAEALVGKQHIQARWSDGASWTGDRTFETLGERPIPVVIRRP